MRDARGLVITDEQFQAFLDRHKDQPSLVPESNEVMKDSYLLLDEEMRYVRDHILCACILVSERFFFCGRFLNCSDSSKTPGRSLLEVGVEEALLDAGFDEKAFFDRGGVFEWTKKKDSEEGKIPEW